MNQYHLICPRSKKCWKYRTSRLWSASYGSKNRPNSKTSWNSWRYYSASRKIFSAKSRYRKTLFQYQYHDRNCRSGSTRSYFVYLHKKGIEILEYTPLQVKKAITGNGQAKKLQLQRAIQMLFWLSDIPKPDDAADAIGIAYMSALRN